MKYENYGYETLANTTSSRKAARNLNAALRDMANVDGFLSEEVRNNIEDYFIHNWKIDRMHDNIRRQCESAQNTSNIVCLGIDSRKESQETHLTFTDETDGLGEYIMHCALPVKGCTGAVLAEATLEVLCQYDSLDSLVAVLVDNTSTNTGCNNGLVAVLHRYISSEVQMIGCALHANELLLRNLFLELDGVASGPTSFTGPIGMAAAEQLHLIPTTNFECIDLFNIDAPENIRKDLSWDQKMLYDYCIGIKNGTVPGAERKIGVLNHSR